MKIIIIVAAAENNVIGKDNRLIWRLPKDMKFFKESTEGFHVLTGRKNYESIPEKFRPLPKRINIVISRDKSYKVAGAHTFHTIEEGIAFAKAEGEKILYIIGGGEIYQQTMGIADKILLTRIHANLEGDTYFPDLDPNLWKEVSREEHQADEKHKYSFTFCVYERKN